MAPIVSVVMPTFNRLEFLPSTIESLFKQTIPDWELVVADDGSNEETLAYLESLTDDERVRVLRLRRSGKPSVARNAAIAASRAGLMALLDSDDLWLPNKLERQIAVLRAHPECRWSYTGFVEATPEGVPLPFEHKRLWIPHAGEIFAQTVSTTASIRLSSVVASTELVREVGGFDETLAFVESYDLWIRLALRSPVCVVDEPLLRVRRHSSNPKRPLGTYHLARDYSLRKLAAQLSGSQRRLVVEQRSLNALRLAATLARHGQRLGSAVAVCKSLPLGWTFPRWWYHAARTLARTIIGGRRSVALRHAQ